MEGGGAVPSSEVRLQSRKPNPEELGRWLSLGARMTQSLTPEHLKSSEPGPQFLVLWSL